MWSQALTIIYFFKFWLIKLRNVNTPELDPWKYWTIIPPETNALMRLVVPTNVIYLNNEYYIYDAYSLIGEVGGIFGLFLGFSLMQALEHGADILAKFWKPFHKSWILRTILCKHLTFCMWDKLLERVS